MRETYALSSRCAYGRAGGNREVRRVEEEKRCPVDARRAQVRATRSGFAGEGERGEVRQGGKLHLFASQVEGSVGRRRRRRVNRQEEQKLVRCGPGKRGKSAVCCHV